MKPASRSLPRSPGKLKGLGARVLVERGAGTAAQFTDNAYGDAELTDAAAILSSADILLCVQPPSIETVNALKPGAVVAGFMQAYARQRSRAGAERTPHHELCDGAGAAHLARPIDGRPVLAGLGRRLQGGADRRQTP